MPGQLGQGFKNVSGMSHDSNFAYLLHKSSFFCLTCSVLELLQHLYFSLLVNPNMLKPGDVLKMEQTDTEATVSFACKKTYSEFLTLSCLKVSVFKGEQKYLKQKIYWS